MKTRLIALGLVVMFLLPLSVLARPRGPVAEPSYVPNVPAVRLAPTLSTVTAAPNTAVLQAMTVFNDGVAGDPVDTYTISFPTQPAGWGITANPNPVANVTPGNSRSFDVLINIPAGTAPGTYTIVVRATAAPSGVEASAQINVTVAAPTATPTATNTPTNTPVPVGSITPTPANICDGGGNTRNDGYEPDGNPNLAKRIEIDIVQIHAMCPTGDEDWVFFGGLEGKVYTIDVPEAAPGLDLSLTLYDIEGNQLAFNDDYYLRNNDPTDVRPRIQSWRAPSNGQYFIKIREAAGRGIVGGLYRVILQSESYGPTPTLIAEICSDLYEPDGLPEIAPLMVVGEVHTIHKLCPRGDADWVKFFAKAGKTHSLFTSNLSVGADTVMVLTDRDGTSIIDFNDDFGADLSSRIDFTPAVDGFYYAQIKNVGDVGNQFISYQLTFRITSNANGGGGGGGGGGGVTPTTAPGITPTRTPATTTPETPEPTRDGTTTTTPTPTGTRTVTPTPTEEQYRTGNNSKLPGFVVEDAGVFADPAFRRVWERADGPVAGGAATRSWLWGPQSGRARVEVYTESNGGLRQVQYFDKSRMEISNFGADRGSQWFVTNGLLAKELITGQIQIGDSSYVASAPAAINIAGDLDDSGGPTYASFARHLGANGNRVGQYATAMLARNGSTSAYAGPQREGAKLVHFVPETGHNIASAFWDFMNRRGPVSEGGNIKNGQVMDWVFALGYPISEPFWARVRVGGVERDVLVQAFERRVLTYTPDNPADWQVEMGNVGQHYHLWRYGSR